MPEKDGPKQIPAIPIADNKPSDHPACGMWRDREDMKDPAAYVRKIRQPRYRWDDELGVVRTER